jgi:hypothetical protein
MCISIEVNMTTIRIEIPTYDPASEAECDYTKPHVLTLRRESGLRIVMGERANEDVPDVLIEREADLWRVIVHPDQGDPLCIIELRRDRATVEDDWGRSLMDRALR